MSGWETGYKFTQFQSLKRFNSFNRFEYTVHTAYSAIGYSAKLDIQ